MALALLPGCLGQQADDLDLDDRSQAIVNGTREPQAVPLSDGEKLAIGWLHSGGFPDANFCTGTLIAPTIVITASHCTQGTSASQVGFGVGLFPSQAQASFRVAQIHNHPSRDAAILVLSEDATRRVSGLVPIRANREVLGGSWEGRTVEASGFGETRDASRDGRWFATLLLESVESESVVVNGQGIRGICFGDSGGPLLSRDGQGRPIVLAVESSGDDSCVGRDYMTRLDAITNWMDPITGPIDPPEEPEELPEDPPVDPPVDDPPQGDACQGIGFEGRCQGDLAQWCQDGQLAQRDCAALGTECAYINAQVGFICDCGDVDAVGRCNGDVAEYCDNGRLARVDCRQRLQGCGFVSAQTGYFCTDTPSCGDVDERGFCAGEAVVTCSGGSFQRLDCGAQGSICVVEGGLAVCRATSPDVRTPGDDGAAPDPDGVWADPGGQGWADEAAQTPDASAAAVCQASPAKAPRAPSLLIMVAVLILLFARRSRLLPGQDVQT